MTTETPPKIAPGCRARHTAYEPTKAEWFCPECMAPGGEFAIYESDEGSSDECERLHNRDALHCYKCGYSISGSRFAARLMKAKNLIPCPACKGHGAVDGSKK